MTGRIVEDKNTWGVFGEDRWAKFYVFDDETQEVMISVNEDFPSWGQRVHFTMTAEAATKLKEFLIKKGY